MTNEIIAAIWGGVFGLVAALIGALGTYWLTQVQEAKKSKAERSALFRTCALEIKSLVPLLKGEGALIIPLEGSTFDLLRQRGFLHELPAESAQLLLELYGMIRQINDWIDKTRRTIDAFTAADTLETQGRGVQPMFEYIKGLKSQALGLTDGCVLALESNS